MGELDIKKTIEIDASPKVVFQAISDPAELTNWFPDAAILEPKVGGKFRFSFFKDSDRRKKMDQDFFPEGKVLEFVPNKKLSYSWQHKNVPDFPETVVTWELEELGKNKTKLTLTHTGFTGGEGMKSSKEHDMGWTYFLGELVSYCKKK
ncbi:MAG TPA: SRPBCC domain-containing protein [Nitrosopumilaceae archaeon]|nr:SRPBCC domain-containing protein [Nitrosopumilaceae archaeon]